MTQPEDSQGLFVTSQQYAAKFKTVHSQHYCFGSGGSVSPPDFLFQRFTFEDDGVLAMQPSSRPSYCDSMTLG
jgi:hypothetical protein